MMADEPMSELRLEQMRGYATAMLTAKHAIEAVSSELVVASDYMLALLAEVERLRAREAAAMEIVRAVAQVVWSSYCPWCNLHGTMREVEHYDDCPVLAARILTGITPADEDE